MKIDINIVLLYNYGVTW